MKRLAILLATVVMAVGGNAALAGKLVNAGKRMIACTQEYAPVCAARVAPCLIPPCPKTYRTFSNACFARAAGWGVAHAGACRGNEGRRVPTSGCGGKQEDPAGDAGCKAWTDGCNICQRTKPGGEAMCSDISCAKRGRPMCLKRF